MDNYIKNQGIIIKVLCDPEILFRLKKEVSSYYEFKNVSEFYDFTLYIYSDQTKYNKVYSLLEGCQNKFNLIKDRKGLVYLNKKKQEIILIYKHINDNVIQFIGEVIISIFGMILERQGYFFLHSACVEKNEMAIAITGNRNSGKTTILNMLLQNHFNFISNSHIAIKDNRNNVKVLGFPSRMGIRIETLEKVINPDIREKIILNTEFKRRFKEDIQKNLSFYRKEKFNIKINEIEEIYDINLISNSNLKLIIVPIYIEQMEHIQIIEIKDIDKQEMLFKNKRTGVYDTIKYMKESKNIINKLPTNLNKVKMYKIYQNENSVNEIIDFINSKIDI